MNGRGTAGSRGNNGDDHAETWRLRYAADGLAIEYIKKHAKDSKPFFMDVNFMKLHQPTSPNKMFQASAPWHL